MWKCSAVKLFALQDNDLDTSKVDFGNMACARGMPLFLLGLDQELDRHAFISVGSAPHRSICIHNIHLTDGNRAASFVSVCKVAELVSEQLRSHDHHQTKLSIQSSSLEIIANLHYCCLYHEL